MDIFPCVEDPQKLAYLDLKGCFGDLVDCAYWNKFGVRSSIQNKALERILEERWAYDDLGEDAEEDSQNISMMSVDSQLSYGGEKERSSEESPEISMIGVVDGKDIEPESNLDEVSNSRVTDNDREISGSPQEDSDVLLRDERFANVELVNFYLEIASRGGSLSLRSVDGDDEPEIFL